MPATLGTNLVAGVPSPIVYVGNSSGRFYALKTDRPLAQSAWPMFHQNVWHTGNGRTLSLSGGSFDGNGDFQFQVQGLVGMVCDLQASHDLTVWNSLGQVTLFSNPILTYVDTQSSGYPYRFYRARSGFITSPDAIGYITVDAPSGLSMIANQLNWTSGNTVNVVLPDLPAGTTLQKWNEATQAYGAMNVFLAGGWSDPTMTLNPGEGAFLGLAAARTLTFIGSIPQGTLLNSIPGAISIRSAMLPLSGDLDVSLGFPAAAGDMVSKYNTASGGYDTYTFVGTAWYPEAPIIAVGESFWINTASPKVWSLDSAPW